MGCPGISSAAKRAQISKQEQRAALRKAAQAACNNSSSRIYSEDGLKGRTNPNCSNARTQAPQEKLAPIVDIDSTTPAKNPKVEFMTADEMKDTCICDGNNLYNYVESGSAEAFKIDGKKVIKYNNGQTFIQGDCGWSQISGKEVTALKDFGSKFKALSIEQAAKMMGDVPVEGKDGVRAKYNNNFHEHNGELIYTSGSGNSYKFNPKDSSWESFDIERALNPKTSMPIRPPKSDTAPAPESSPTKMTTGNNKVKSSTKNNAEPRDQDKWMDDAMKEAFKINDQQIKEQAKLKQQEATKAQEQAELQKNLRAQPKEHADSTWTEINREHQLQKGKELPSGLGAKVSAIGSAISEGLNDIESDATADLLNSLPATTDSVNGKSEAELKLIQDLENGIVAISKHLPGGLTDGEINTREAAKKLFNGLREYAQGSASDPAKVKELDKELKNFLLDFPYANRDAVKPHIKATHDALDALRDHRVIEEEGSNKNVENALAGLIKYLPQGDSNSERAVRQRYEQTFDNIRNFIQNPSRSEAERKELNDQLADLRLNINSRLPNANRINLNIDFNAINEVLRTIDTTQQPQKPLELIARRDVADVPKQEQRSSTIFGSETKPVQPTKPEYTAKQITIANQTMDDINAWTGEIAKLNDSELKQMLAKKSSRNEAQVKHVEMVIKTFSQQNLPKSLSKSFAGVLEQASSQLARINRLKPTSKQPAISSSATNTRLPYTNYNQNIDPFDNNEGEIIIDRIKLGTEVLSTIPEENIGAEDPSATPTDPFQ